jgi:hypothetical protein
MSRGAASLLPPSARVVEGVWFHSDATRFHVADDAPRHFLDRAAWLMGHESSAITERRYVHLSKIGAQRQLQSRSGFFRPP